MISNRLTYLKFSNWSILWDSIELKTTKQPTSKILVIDLDNCIFMNTTTDKDFEFHIRKFYLNMKRSCLIGKTYHFIVIFLKHLLTKNTWKALKKFKCNEDQEKKEIFKKLLSDDSLFINPIEYCEIMKPIIYESAFFKPGFK